MNKILEDFFKEGLDSNIIDYKLRVSKTEEGAVWFYIHPDGRDGETPEFFVNGNSLVPKMNTIFDSALPPLDDGIIRQGSKSISEDK